MNRIAAVMAPFGVAILMTGSAAAWAAPLSGPAGTKPAIVFARLKPIAGTQSQGSGVLVGSFDEYTHEFAWKVVYQNLSSQVISARIHGPSHPGHNAPVILPLTPPYSSPILGVVDVPGGTSAKITGGYAYAVISTKNYPAGEIRGRIHRQK